MARPHGDVDGSGRRPLGELISREMVVQSLSLAQVAELVHRAATASSTYSRATPQLVSKWRRGRVTPGPHHVRLLARALNLPLEAVAAAAETQRGQEAAALPASPRTLLNQPGPAVGDPGYAELLRHSIQSLVALDTLLGGDDAAALALRLFASARQRFAEAGWERPDRAELLSTIAELAEVAGWLLFDSNRQSGAAELNHQALLLAQLSGNQDVEVLTLQNMSLQALWCGQAAESLALAKRLQELEHVGSSARLRALLDAREARALAQMGRRHDALAAFERARVAFSEGTSMKDPLWTWWLDEAEFSYHEGQMRADLHDWAAAELHLRRAIDDCPQNRSRDRTLYRAYLLDALIRMKAEPEATRLIEEQAKSAGEVRSSRTAAVLSRALAGIDPLTGSLALRDAGRQLHGGLTLEGYLG